MKKQFLILFFLLIGYSLQSQVLIALLLGDMLNTGKVEFGLDGGLNFAGISNMDSHKKLSEFNLGFYFDIKMKEQWYFNTGVLVKSTLGVDNLTMDDLSFLNATIYKDQNAEIVEGAYSQKMSYFLVPALAKYKFKNNMFVEAGPQFGLMYKAWVQFDSDIDGNNTRIKENNKDMINRFDMGIAAGTGYRLLNGMGWTVGIRYYYGFLDVYKDKSGTKNNSLFLKLYIPIGASDETKAKVQEQKEIIKEKKAQKKRERKQEKIEINE